MLKLKVNSTSTAVIGNSTYGVMVIRKATRARPEGYVWSRKYRDGVWDGWINLFKRNKFPSGLLAKVVNDLNDTNVKYQVVDMRKALLSKKVVRAIPRTLGEYTLRDYQYDAAVTLMKRPDGIAKMATNAGKTFVFGAMIAALPEARSVVVVRSRDLLYQTADMLDMLTGFSVGRVGDGLYDVSQQITVLSIDTLMTRYKQLANDMLDVSMLLVDECHHASAPKIRDVLSKFPKSALHRRYGFSGTPLHYNVLDDLNVLGMLGPIVVDVTNAALIEQGYSASPVIHMHDVTSTAPKDLDYDIAYEAFIVNSQLRNSKIAALAQELVTSGPTLVMVDRIEHGKRRCDLLADQFYSTYVFATGSMPSEERKKLLDRMRNGDKIVVVSTIFKEGIDVPNVRSLIIACGGSGSSHIKLLQMIGRAIRKKETTDFVDIHDFNDLTNEYLHQHSIERVALYTSEGFNVIRSTWTI